MNMENDMTPAPAITPGRNPADEADPEKFYTWTVELSVSATWVADGFDLEDDDAVAALLLEGRLSHCRSDEVRGKVVKAPPKAEVAWEQGAPVPDLEAMKVLVKLSDIRRERLMIYGRCEAAGVNYVAMHDKRLETLGLVARRFDNYADAPNFARRAPTPLGWRVLAYLGVKPARKAA